MQRQFSVSRRDFLRSSAATAAAVSGGVWSGLTAAEAILAGADPDAALRKAIRPYRYFNYLWWFETTKMAKMVEMLMRVSVPLAMLYPHTRQTPYWAAAKR